jgi:8-oxo-dGTP diphosphatase
VERWIFLFWSIVANYVQWLRKYVGNHKLILTGTAAMVRDEQGRVLLQQRRDNGLWSLPGGGTELGENAIETNAREVREEMGVEVAVKHLLGLYTSPSLDVKYPNGDETQIVVPCFECVITGGELKKQESEVLDLGWFDLADANLPPLTSFAQVVLRDAERYSGKAFFELERDHITPHRNGDDSASYVQWLRSHVGKQRVVLTGAGSVIRDERGRVLLQKRSDDGLWALPGGLQELGESLADTVRRETCEEVGLQVEPRALIGVYTAPELDRSEFPNGDQAQMFIALFDCAVIGGKLQAQESEVLELGWFDLDDLPTVIKSTAIHARDAKHFRGEAFVR